MFRCWFINSNNCTNECRVLITGEAVRREGRNMISICTICSSFLQTYRLCHAAPSGLSSDLQKQVLPMRQWHRESWAHWPHPFLCFKFLQQHFMAHSKLSKSFPHWSVPTCLSRRAGWEGGCEPWAELYPGKPGAQGQDPELQVTQNSRSRKQTGLVLYHLLRSVLNISWLWETQAFPW